MTDLQRPLNSFNSQRQAGATSLGIGMDFGTTNSAAAIFDGEKIHLVSLESHSVAMPSAIYIDRQFQVCTGQSAIDRYIADNMGRKVELSAELLGEGRTTTGQIGEGGLPEEASSSQIFGQSFVDAGEKGRLFRGIKRLLGGSIQRLMVFDRPFRLVALVTPIIVRIRETVAQTLRKMGKAGESSDHACIGHPVNFEGRETDHNATALARLAESCHHAGFTQQRFYPEPLAAALSFLHSNPGTEAKKLLCVDFGGGTLDLCVLQRSALSFDVVAIHGVGLGGDHIDQCLFREILFPLLGKGESWRRKGEDREIETMFPFEDYEDFILNWPVSYMLNQNRYTTPVQQRIEQGGEGKVKFERLYELIKHNYSYLVFQALKDVKAQLSEQDEAVLDIPEIDVEMTVTRPLFESLIVAQLDIFRQAVDDTLQRAGMQPHEIDVVVSTGGSSLIPAVRNILDGLFPGKVLEHDPFTSVAAGLAIAEYEGLSLNL